MTLIKPGYLMNSKPRTSGGGGGSTVTFLSSGIGPHLSLGNANQEISTLGGAASWESANMSSSAKSSGKWYAEFKNVNGSVGIAFFCGIYQGAFSLGTNFVGEVGTDMGFMSNAQIFSGGSSVASHLSWAATGDVAQLAVDVSNSKLWCGVNNTFNGDPVAGTGGTAISSTTWKLAASVVNTLGVGIPIRINNTLAFTPPTGYSRWT